MNRNSFNIGDKVCVLDDTLEGIVASVDSQGVHIETPEGFLLVFKPEELVLVSGNEHLQRVFSGQNLQDVLKEKKEPAKRRFVKEKKSKKEEFVLEVDLHIEKLVPSTKGMTNYDILTLQMDVAKRQLEFALKNRIPRVVFIHGVGEGVLKAELDFLLQRYDMLTFQDADYQKYGVGATEVYFIQKKIMRELED